VVGSLPQDLKYTGAESEVIIGDDTTIREYATINIATAEGERTRVGSHCLLMAYSHVAHNCVLGDHVIIANAVNLAGHVTVDDHAIIGGVTPVHQFVLIGAHAFVGGGSRIPQDVPPFVKVAGTPPLPAGINSVGLARRGFTEDQIARIKRAYRAIYRRGLRLEEAAAEIALEGDDQVGRIFADFFARSHRGIVR
jgi:UDP-N-acetylglucosamine acyltransferase